MLSFLGWYSWLSLESSYNVREHLFTKITPSTSNSVSINFTRFIKSYLALQLHCLSTLTLLSA